MKLETMKVKPADPSQGRWVVINVRDFNPDIHEALEDEAPKQRGRPRKQKDEE